MKYSCFHLLTALVFVSGGCFSGSIGDTCSKESDCNVGLRCFQPKNSSGSVCTVSCQIAACTSGVCITTEDGRVCASPCSSETDCEGELTCQSQVTGVINIVCWTRDSHLSTDLSPVIACEGNCPDMQWATIPGGSFLMGSKEEDNEQPIHRVTIKPFEMAKTETTVSQYKACVRARQCTKPQFWFADGDDVPVREVYWNQASDFCTWVGGRLPSEAEWEYAATSGGKIITYPWGNEPATCEYAVMNETRSSFTEDWGCETGSLWPVCSMPAGNTDHGLCDMAGNANEWVEDDSHRNYNGSPNDGSAWVEDPRLDYRVFRGGSYSSDADELRATRRVGNNIKHGFRCAR